HSVALSEANVLGVLSLFLWSMLLIVSLKYVVVIMRADNRGEGGILALTALTGTRAATARETLPAAVALGLFGAALLYGDGVITPAISVLSAVEGLKVATPALESYVVPVTVAILVGLFAIQPLGTGRVGRFFGPLIALWFAVLAVLGIVHLVQTPSVLRALDPRHG